MVLPPALIGEISEFLITAGSVTALFTAGKRVVLGWQAKNKLARELSKDDLKSAFGASAQDTVRNAAARLQPTDRAYVEDALAQASERGRQTYADDAILAARGEAQTVRAE